MYLLRSVTSLDISQTDIGGFAHFSFRLLRSVAFRILQQAEAPWERQLNVLSLAFCLSIAVNSVPLKHIAYFRDLAIGGQSCGMA